MHHKEQGPTLDLYFQTSSLRLSTLNAPSKPSWTLNASKLNITLQNQIHTHAELSICINAFETI